MFEQLAGVRGQLSALVTALDPDAVSGPAAAQLWAEFDRVERLAAAAKTLLARRVAATHRGDRTGATSAAADLARRGGTSTGAAKEALETSRRLAGLPGVAGAVRRGELSAPQAALVAAAAAADPAAEARLLELAGRVSVQELREACARVRAAADPDPEATNRRLHAERRLRRWTDAEGGWNLVARGTPQQGAAFNTALDPIIDQIFRAAWAQGRRETQEAYAFDALIAMAERAAGCGPAADQPAGSRGDHDDAGPDAAAAATDASDAPTVDGGDSAPRHPGAGEGEGQGGRPDAAPGHPSV